MTPHAPIGSEDDPRDEGCQTRQGIKIDPGSRHLGGIAHAGSTTWLLAGPRTLPPLYARWVARSQDGRRVRHPTGVTLSVHTVKLLSVF